jgi:hypothetical protein
MACLLPLPSGREGGAMLKEVLSVVFMIGVPIWLVVEEILHRSRVRVNARRPREIRKSAHKRLKASRLPRVA